MFLSKFSYDQNKSILLKISRALYPVKNITNLAKSVKANMDVDGVLRLLHFLQLILSRVKYVDQEELNILRLTICHSSEPKTLRIGGRFPAVLLFRMRANVCLAVCERRLYTLREAHRSKLFSSSIPASPSGWPS